MASEDKPRVGHDQGRLGLQTLRVVRGAVRASHHHRPRGPHEHEMRGECAEAILRHRRERAASVAADWLTREEYQEALAEHPEFMMTEEELDRAEELGLYDDFFRLADLR